MAAIEEEGIERILVVDLDVHQVGMSLEATKNSEGCMWQAAM